MSKLSAFYTLLLRKRVAMPHGTSRLYNLVSVPTGFGPYGIYTTSRACGPRLCISRRDLHLVVKPILIAQVGKLLIGHKTNGHVIWLGNETSCTHVYKIRKWRPSQRTATTERCKWLLLARVNLKL